MRNGVFMMLFMLMVCPAHLVADTLYVNSGTGNDTTGDGSAGSPWATITKGITEASSGDTLNVTGTFTGEGVTRDGIVIDKTLTIAGQGADTTTVQSATTLGGSDRRVFTIHTGGITVTLKNMTIRHGRVVDGQTDPYGGGVDVTSGATVTIRKCHILDNESYNNGGGICAYESTLTVENSTIEGNNGYNGGGIEVQSSTATITNCTIHANTAEDSAYGGGVDLTGSTTATITNCTITENDAYGDGGGICLDATLYLKNTILANNADAQGDTDFYRYSGTVNDNGYNIVENSSGYTFSGTGDITGNQVNLNLSSSLADNNTTNGTPTLALSAGSVAINAGNGTANNGVSIPATDQRDAGRDGTVDIGAYEYNGALLIELASFTATASRDAVTIEWSTVSEIDTAGFHLWRADSAGAEYVRLTEGMIPAEGGPTWGAVYRYEDDGVTAGRTYFYRLADLSFSGSQELHGPVFDWVGTVDVKSGGQDDPVIVAAGEAILVTASLRAGERAGRPADIWVAVHTTLAPPADWCSLVRTDGWQHGLAPFARMPLPAAETAIQLLHRSLPPGDYTFHIAVDPPDGLPAGPWYARDTVQVSVR